MNEELPGYDVVAARWQGVCDCSHWIIDHIEGEGPCIAADCDCELFAFSIDLSHPQRVAEREGDPHRWPAYVDRYFAEQLLRSES